LLGVAARADSLRERLRLALDSVRGRTARLPVIDVVYVVGLDPLMVAAGGTFIDELITIAGGRNIFGDLKLWPQVNLEELLQRDPAVIVIADTNTDNPVELLRGLPGWRELDAVQNGRVYRVSPYFFNRSGPTMPDAARELARFFHGP
jgi:iron complex transport system substrate-binding protein